MHPYGEKLNKNKQIATDQKEVTRIKLDAFIEYKQLIIPFKATIVILRPIPSENPLYRQFQTLGQFAK